MDRFAKNRQEWAELILKERPELTPARLRNMLADPTCDDQAREHIDELLAAHEKDAQPAGHPGHYHVGRNVPGYLPEAPVACYDGLDNALAGLREQLNDQSEEFLRPCVETHGLSPEDGFWTHSCSWNSLSTDVYADMVKISDGDAEYAAVSRGGLGFTYSPPEGSDVSHWLNIEPGPQDQCELADEEVQP